MTPTVEITIPRLNGSEAKKISQIARDAGVRVQRRAMGRKEIGLCKVVFIFDSPNYLDNVNGAAKLREALRPVIEEIKNVRRANAFGETAT